MRADWQHEPLAEVCQFLNGLWKGEKPPFVEIPVIRNTNFTKEGVLDDSDIAYIPVEAKQFEKRRLECGDVILEKSGGGPKQPVGRVVLFDKRDGAFSFSNFTSALRIRDRNRIDPRFLHKFLHWTYTAGVTENMQSHSTGIRNLDTAAYKAIEVPIPPLHEQRRIVAILDEAFAAIATAKANTEKNLQNARALFLGQLRAVMTQSNELNWHFDRSEEPPGTPREPLDFQLDNGNGSGATRTKTGGRPATQRHIPEMFSLAVGLPHSRTREGWRWSRLADLATLESGHTPSRNHREYWGGPIPWVGIQDAREHHGREIYDTIEHTNELGIANSSARILPPRTVCLSRTASVGYVVVTGRPMATSQDFVNWVCSHDLSPDFLKYVFLAEGPQLLRFASGAVHSTIYFPEAKAFCVCHPGLTEQIQLARRLDELHEQTRRLEAAYMAKLGGLQRLKKSVLRQAFSGSVVEPR